ncbi:helix-turn-helix domain-containing protein [Intestinibacillus massiliensis]|nr:helix-turn-helix domain-containing protein [Intestinibacillus massiliensis]
MYKNRSAEGRANICGYNIMRLRKEQEGKLSQRALADKLQLVGIDLDKNAIQRIESGLRFVTDIELRAFAAVFDVTADTLLESPEMQ